MNYAYRLSRQWTGLGAACALFVAGAGMHASLAYGKDEAAALPPGCVVGEYTKECGRYIVNRDIAKVPAGRYVLDPHHSHLVFQMVHYGGLSRPLLRFRDIQSDFTLDPAHPEATKIKVRIAPTSLDSGVKDFDMRMNAPDVLRGYDASEGGKYRFITYESKKITFKDANSGDILGDLTILGVTRPVVVHFTFNGSFHNVLDERKMGFSGNGAFKRSDFGLTSVPTAADDVTFMLEMEFAKFKGTESKE